MMEDYYKDVQVADTQGGEEEQKSEQSESSLHRRPGHYRVHVGL